MAKKESNLTLGISEPEKVESYLSAFEHPLKEIVLALRHEILQANQLIGEGIYWNAPTFFYTGEMETFNPKEYKRYLVGFVFNRTDCIRLVFLKGATVNDSKNVLEGNFKDERKLMVFQNMEDVQNKKEALKEILNELITKI